MRLSTCARDGGEHPALAVTDGATLVPPPQDVGAAVPVPREDPVRVLVPLSHKNAVVVVAVDLCHQSKEDRIRTARRSNAACLLAQILCVYH